MSPNVLRAATLLVPFTALGITEQNTDHLNLPWFLPSKLDPVARAEPTRFPASSCLRILRSVPREHTMGSGQRVSQSPLFREISATRLATVALAFYKPTPLHLGVLWVPPPCPWGRCSALTAECVVPLCAGAFSLGQSIARYEGHNQRNRL